MPHPDFSQPELPYDTSAGEADLVRITEITMRHMNARLEDGDTISAAEAVLFGLTSFSQLRHHVTLEQRELALANLVEVADGHRLLEGIA